MALKSLSLWGKNDFYNTAAPFWARIFAVTFVMGVVTGTSMEFQFGTTGRAFILGLLASAAFSLYPMVLPAVNPAYSLTIHNASSSLYGQTVGLVWWSIGIVLAAIYFILTYRLFWGKIQAVDAEGY